MMLTNTHEAKTHLSRLLTRAESGEEIIIARAGKPIAKLVPFKPERTTRKPGVWKGKVKIADDFDELPADLLSGFSGESQ